MLSRQTSSTLAGSGQSRALLQDLHQGLMFQLLVWQSLLLCNHSFSTPFVLLAGHPQLSSLMKAIEYSSHHIIVHAMFIYMFINDTCSLSKCCSVARCFNHQLQDCFMVLHYLCAVLRVWYKCGFCHDWFIDLCSYVTRHTSLDATGCLCVLFFFVSQNQVVCLGPVVSYPIVGPVTVVKCFTVVQPVLNVSF